MLQNFTCFSIKHTTTKAIKPFATMVFMLFFVLGFAQNKGFYVKANTTLSGTSHISTTTTLNTQATLFVTKSATIYDAKASLNANVVKAKRLKQKIKATTLKKVAYNKTILSQATTKPKQKRLGKTQFTSAPYSLPTRFGAGQGSTAVATITTTYTFKNNTKVFKVAKHNNNVLQLQNANTKQQLPVYTLHSINNVLAQQMASRPPPMA